MWKATNIMYVDGHFNRHNASFDEEKRAWLEQWKWAGSDDDTTSDNNRGGKGWGHVMHKRTNEIHLNGELMKMYDRITNECVMSDEMIFIVILFICGNFSIWLNKKVIIKLNFNCSFNLNTHFFFVVYIFFFAIFPPFSVFILPCSTKSWKVKNYIS